MKLNFKLFKDYLLILCFIYLPHLKIGPLIVPTFYLFLLWGIFHIILNKKLVFPSLLTVVFPIQLFFLSLTNAYNGYIEFSLSKELLLFPIYYTVGSILIFKILKNRSLNYLIKLIAFALITNSTLILILVSFQDLNPIFHEFIHITPKSQKYIYDMPLNIRHSGLGVSGFSYLSVKTICLYFIILFYQNQKKDINNFLIHLTSLTVISSLIFVARTGLFIGLIGYLIYLIVAYRKKFLFIFFSIILSSSLIVNFYLNLDDDSTKLAIERSFNLFLSAEENGTLNTLEYEVNSLNINNFLLGDKDYGRDRGLISDIGYISFLKGGGVFAIIIFILHWIVLIINTMFNSNDWIKKSIFYLSIIFLIFNGKELVFYGHGYMQSIIILLIIYENKKYNFNNSII